METGDRDPILIAGYDAVPPVATEQVVVRRRRRSSGTAGDAVGACGQDRLGLCCCVVEGIAESVGVFFPHEKQRRRWVPMGFDPWRRGRRVCGGRSRVRNLASHIEQ
jgi:hypothetical protein